jgi:GNAT superfamily N-acetyltransferase
MVTVNDVGWEHLAEFARLYRQTMVRTGASDYYFFGEEDFRRLRQALEGRLHLLVTLAGSDVAAAGLFTEFNRLVEWHLVADSADYRNQSPGKLLVDDAVVWAQARGMRLIHLGGGRGGRNDTLLWSKSRFSALRHAFHTGRWILSRSEYDALVAARLAAIMPDSMLEPNFFPIYRATPVGRQPSSSPAHPPAIEIRPVTPAEAAALGELLPTIDPTFFRPHPMTPEEARRIAHLEGDDVYMIGFANAAPVAYGILRGWDEGYDVPSLGVGVRREMERRGYGRAMMLHLHQVARSRGATHVRLRVHADNVGAAALYRQLGYEEVGVERSEVLMKVHL